MANDLKHVQYADMDEDAGFATAHGTPLDDETIHEMFPDASPEQRALIKWSSGQFKPGELILRQDLPISTFRLFTIAEGEVECVLMESDRKTVRRVLEKVSATKHNGQYILIPEEANEAPYAIRAVTHTRVLRINGKLVQQLLTRADARENAIAHSRKIFRGLSEEYGIVRGKSGYSLAPYLLQLFEVVSKNPDLEQAILNKIEQFAEWAVKYDPTLPHKHRTDNEFSLNTVQLALAKLARDLGNRRE